MPSCKKPKFPVERETNIFRDVDKSRELALLNWSTKICYNITLSQLGGQHDTEA